MGNRVAFSLKYFPVSFMQIEYMMCCCFANPWSPIFPHHKKLCHGEIFPARWFSKSHQSKTDILFVFGYEISKIVITTVPILIWMFLSRKQSIVLRINIHKFTKIIHIKLHEIFNYGFIFKRSFSELQKHIRNRVGFNMCLNNRFHIFISRTALF